MAAIARKETAFDLGSAINDEIRDAVNQGVPDAMTEMPSWDLKPAIELATPPARPGYVQRWVRVLDVEGQTDKANIDEAKRLGWKPRQPDAETKKAGYSDDGGVFSYKGQLVLFEMQKTQYDRVLAVLTAEEERINRVIYSDTSSKNGLPGRYASLGFDAGRDAGELID